MTGEDELKELLRKVKLLAKEYRELTGRPLGVTGEVAEYEAARLLDDVELLPPRQAGYDATRGGQRLQIKGRCVLDATRAQRVGRIDVGKPWDAVLLVLLDENFEATAIYEADRGAVEAAIAAPGSKARAGGALATPWSALTSRASTSTRSSAVARTGYPRYRVPLSATVASVSASALAAILSRLCP